MRSGSALPSLDHLELPSPSPGVEAERRSCLCNKDEVGVRRLLTLHVMLYILLADESHVEPLLDELLARWSPCTASCSSMASYRPSTADISATSLPWW